MYADSGGLSLSGEDDGWAYTVKAAPLPDKLNLDLDVSRKYNGLVVKVTGSGSVQNFETAATIMVKDSQLKYFDYENKNLNGQVNFGWEAAKDEAGVEASGAEDQAALFFFDSAAHRRTSRFRWK